MNKDKVTLLARAVSALSNGVKPKISIPYKIDDAEVILEITFDPGYTEELWNILNKMLIAEARGG